jgi:hypothetical protein
MNRKPKVCPHCLNTVKRVAHYKRGEIVVTINGRSKINPPMEIITFYPCGHTIEKRITHETE